MWIFTTEWHYNHRKCILAYNSHILYCIFKNLISTRSVNLGESRGISHVHPFFFPANLQHVTNLLFQTPPRKFHRLAPNFRIGQNFDRPNNNQLIKITTSYRFGYKHKVLHISTMVCPNDMKLRILLKHEPLSLCATFQAMNTRWRSSNFSILYYHIS